MISFKVCKVVKDNWVREQMACESVNNDWGFRWAVKDQHAINTCPPISHLNKSPMSYPMWDGIRPNRSTDDAISHVLHTTLSHLDEGKGNYARLLFIDYSSDFNTIVPNILVTKLKHLGLNTSLCSWVLSFLTDRPQAVKIGSSTSNTVTLNIGAPQGCVLSPLLYSLYTHDCKAKYKSNLRMLQ